MKARILILFLFIVIIGCLQLKAGNDSMSNANETSTFSNKIRTIEMNIGKEFSPSLVKTNLGDKIALKLIGSPKGCGNPAIAIRRFDVEKEVPLGEVTTVEFTADKKGSFPIRSSKTSCRMCHWSMKGELVVE